MRSALQPADVETGPVAAREGPFRAARRLVGSAGFSFAVSVLLIELASRAFVSDLSYHGRLTQLVELCDALAEWPRPPKVVFLGSSHTQCDVAARRVEESLGWPRGAILNAGRSGTGPREALYVYRANRGLLHGADLVFVEVSARDFNRNLDVVEGEGPAAWRRRAGLGERIRYPAGTRVRADWVVGWLFATWDFRDTWNDLARVGYRRGRAWAGWPLRRPVFDGDGRAVVLADLHLTDVELRSRAEQAVHRHMQEYRMDPEAYGSLVELVRSVEADGGRPVLIEFPTSEAHRRLLDSRHAGAERAWREELASRLPRLPPVAVLEATDAVSLSPEDFRDADHLSRAGAIKLSRALARRINEALAFAQPEALPPSPSRVGFGAPRPTEG